MTISTILRSAIERIVSTVSTPEQESLLSGSLDARTFLAAQRDLAVKIQYDLATDVAVEVRVVLASNTSIDSTTQAILSGYPDPQVLSALAANARVTPVVQVTLAKSCFAAVRTHLAANTSISREAQLILGADDDSNVQQALARNMGVDLLDGVPADFARQANHRVFSEAITGLERSTVTAELRTWTGTLQGLVDHLHAVAA